MKGGDLGQQMTDRELAALEKRIAKLYSEAGDELQETIDEYFKKFEKRDKEMRALIGTIQNGKEWTEQDYKQWRLAQIGRGKRFEAMRDKVARRATDANEVARAYINDTTPGIYSLNRNYAAYTIEQVSGSVGFDLWDEQTVKRLIKEQPELMPYYPPERALKRGIDLAWGKKQITASVTSSILQGKGIKGMADDLQRRITDMSRDSAIRTARTAVTGAQNAGRMNSYTAAEKMGIELKKEWLATLDGRTRHSHAMLDREQQDNDKPFSNGCMFPGDPSGPAAEIYNCRCTLIAAIPRQGQNGQRRARDPAIGKNVLIEDMTYAEWVAFKQGHNEKHIKDVSEDYLKTVNRSTGNLKYEEGYRQKDHNVEILVANQIKEQFGGEIILLKEKNSQKEKTPDYLWRGKQWELKSITTAKAADSAVRSAMKQINENPGGIVLQCIDDSDIKKVIEIVDARVKRNLMFDFDIIALSTDGSLLFARRYKK